MQIDFDKSSGEPDKTSILINININLHMCDYDYNAHKQQH